MIVRSAPDVITASYNACLHRGTKLKPSGTAGTSQSIGHFHGFTQDLGDATLVSIANPATATTTFANRMLVSGQNGNLQNTVSRYIGTVRVGGLPANVPAPRGTRSHLSS